MNAALSVGVQETAPTVRGRRGLELYRTALKQIEGLQFGGGPVRASQELGVAALWAVRAGASAPRRTHSVAQLAGAVELTQRALEWHWAAASGRSQVGVGTLAGDYCLAQAAALLTRCGSVEYEAALADGLTAAGAALATGADIEVVVRQLLPPAGWSAARAAGASGEAQARWWRGGRRLAAVGGTWGDSLPVPPEVGALLSSVDPLERQLGRTLSGDPAAVAAPMARLLGAGGKRIRARLLLIAAEVGHLYRPGTALSGAAAMEIIHAATLCHDDLVDGADSRRGAPTVAATQGPLVALGVGDFYLGRASGMVARLGDVRVSRAFAGALVEIADGQLLELERRSVWSGALTPYIQVARRKTGSLLSACGSIGALVSGASASEVRAVARFARDLGLAFQGIDDCLDFSDPGRTGKPAGIDLAQGICGLPVLCALRGPRRAEVLVRLRRMEGASPPEAAALREQVVSLVHESGALAGAREVADGWSGEALGHIDDLPASLRARLEAFADRLTLRDR